ncbi:phage holin family protein [Nocardioides dongxiaopingii]|uniref:phage holin family protein n=1 Tax=Nocardioides TaxID=1839 RepID=UPI0010C764F4|nr:MULTISPECIES: phage holin family protein [Nocardioides]QCW51603.1 phage holin family protein [Nocardioides sp. S-1144]
MSTLDPHGATASASHDPAGSGHETRSLGEIVGEVTADLSTLMKQELELAKVELKQEATKAGKGAGMLAGAGVAGHLVLVFLSLALMFVLDNVMPIELAALITAVVWGVVAAILAVLGRSNLKKANPQLPKTQQTLKEDASWAKTQTS